MWFDAWATLIRLGSSFNPHSLPTSDLVVPSPTHFGEATH
ncbi:protein of unknown function [Pseudomonas mediterranea]